MSIITTRSYTLTISDVYVHYELYNSHANKPFAVLIHGFLSSVFSYRRLVPYLTDSFAVLAIDLPPFGKSEKSTRFRYTYKNLAKLVIELLKHLQIKRCILIGHSMGGQICLNIARQQPELVQQIILLCGSAYLNRAKTSLLLSSYLPFFHLYVKKSLGRSGVEKTLLNVVYDPSIIDEEMKKGYEEPFYNPQIFVALTRMLRHREGDLPSQELNKIEIPTLLIWGEEDRVVPIHIGKRLHDDLPNSCFLSLPKTGHLLPKEKPVEIYKQIIRFVK